MELYLFSTTLILGMDRGNFESLNVKPNVVIHQLKLFRSNVSVFEIQPMKGLAGIRSRVFRDMTPCNMAQGYRRFGEHAAFIFRVAAYSLKSDFLSPPALPGKLPLTFTAQ